MAGVDFKQIEAELREFGEVVDKKRFTKNPEVFIKKLNHLRARNKQQTSPGRTTRSGIGSRVGDNAVNGNDSDDDFDEDEEEEDSKRRTRKGVVVEKSVTEKKTRRQTIHELPSSGRMSPSRKVGVPVPAGPILNSNDLDKRSTRRRSALHTPISTRYTEDSDDFEEPLMSNKWSGSGLGTSVDPRPGRASAYQSSSQLSTKTLQGSGRSLFGVGLPSFSRDKQDTNISKNKSEKVSSSSRSRLADFSDDEADYKAQEIADVGVNTSGKWQDSPISSDLNSSKSRIGFSGLFSSKDGTNNVPLNKSFGANDYTLSGHKSLYESTPSTVASSYTSSLSSDSSSKSDGRRYSRQWSVGASKALINGQAVCSFVAKYLFVVPVVIFAVIIALYVNLKLQPSIDNSSGNFMACIGGESDDTNCLNDEQVKEVKSAIHKLLDILSTRAGEYDCTSSSLPRFMTVDEAMTKLKHGNSTFTDVKRLLEVIKLNPDWKIRLLENDCVTETSVIKSVTCLESIRPTMGVICRLRLFIEQTFYMLCMIVVGIAIVGLLVLLVIKYRKYKAAKVKELHLLVDDIIGMLRNHANAYNQNRGVSDIPPYIPVPHVRDALIPMKDRKKKQGLWNKAVRFLSDNESRVRKETHLIDGEETLCLKWLETYSDKVFNTGREQTRSSLTGLSTRPSSSCLKISNMLRDYSEDQLPEIRDAILEKCGTYHGILHLDIDSSMKDCVYIKCVSEKAAGQNYKFLHGWWYDGRIVSVQYVGEGLYRSIFPDSTYAMVPLRSSKSRPNYGSGSPGRT